MSTKTTKGLSDTLFKTLEGVVNGTIDLEQAKGIVNVTNAIVNVAKLELSVMKETKQELSVGIVPALGSPLWLEDKNGDSIRTISAHTKEELLKMMSEFTTVNKTKSPDLISNKYNGETGRWEAQYRLTNNY